MRTKIVIFFIATTSLIFFSCENSSDTYQTIPNIRVSFSLSTLNTPELQTLLTPKYVEYANGKKVGYKGHGVYVIQTNSGKYKAFDASCPYISGTENHASLDEHLLQKEKGSIIVYCPKCKSEFNLQYGTVQSGKAKHQLREYKTSVSGQTVRVFN